MLSSCISKFYISNNIAQTKEIALATSPEILSTKIAAFYGDLGAGKTLMCQSIISNLCRDENLLITSPTFNIVKIYHTPFGELHHYDLYRVKHSVELEEVGLLDDLQNSSNICLIEWPQIAEQFMHKKYVKIDIKFIENYKRQISIGLSSS
jgi:tRNA threonylcarbamoyladenosine biosynthesis protein TsaE